MPNINKVVFGSTTLIDLTDSTLSSADQLASGVTAYDRSGTKLTGTGSSGGGGITKETVEVTAASSAYTLNFSVTGDVSKVLFAHFWDNDAVYTTSGTTYEGFRPGPALAKLAAINSDKNWINWRTNAAGSTTGWVNYQNVDPFGTSGKVIVNMNPTTKIGHKYTLEVFYGP